MAQDPLTEVIDGVVKEFEGAIGGIFSGSNPLSGYATEIFWVLAAVAAFAGIFLANIGAGPIAAGVYFVPLLAFLRWLGSRMQNVEPRLRFVRRSLDSSRTKRKWGIAVQHCGFKHPIPVSKVTRVPAGYRARVRVGHGISFKEVEMRREHLAASMGIRELVVSRDAQNAATGTVTLVTTDLLADVAGAAWPGAPDEPRRAPRVRAYRPDDEPPRNRFVEPDDPGPPPPGGTSLWDPIPIGIDEHGNPVYITLPERSLLVGGIPGSGKSIFLSMPLARAALDPTVKLFLVDGKEVELHMWEGCAEEAAYSIEEAIALLGILQRRMQERLKALRTANLQKVERDGGMPLYALFIDELALFTANPDTKLAKEFTGLLIDIAQRGRAAGIVPVMATQKPEGRVVDTNLRDLLAYRLAYCCSSPQASDTILGSNMASQGYNAQSIPIGTPGVGFLLAEDGIPRRIRTYHNNNEAIRGYAALALEGRRRT